MNVPLTPNEEVQLSEVARHAGTNAEQLVRAAALRLLEDDAEFRADTQRGIDQANRGELIDEEEMDARIERMFQR